MSSMISTAYCARRLLLVFDILRLSRRISISCIASLIHIARSLSRFFYRIVGLSSMHTLTRSLLLSFQYTIMIGSLSLIDVYTSSLPLLSWMIRSLTLSHLFLPLLLSLLLLTILLMLPLLLYYSLIIVTPTKVSIVPPRSIIIPDCNIFYNLPLLFLYLFI